MKLIEHVFLASLVFIKLSMASIRSFDLVVERKLVNLDGYVRDAITVNQNFLGPTIEANVGDTLLVTVTNKILMQEALSMHWHGIKQTGTPWADGTAFITNCPITFGSSFTYNFTTDEPGTFWYHGHIGSLSMEGTAGMIVVYDHSSSAYPLQTRSKFGDYEYDEEVRVVLSDWYHASAYTLNSMIEHNPFQWVGSGDSILTNGKGESKFCSYNGSTTTVTTTYADGTEKTVTTSCKGNREVFSLQRGKTYLFRILNAASLAFFNFAVAGHYFTILGVDGGSFTQPVDVASVDLSSGQRYMALLRYNDTIVDANSKPNGTYLIQIQTDWRATDMTNSGIGHAYLTYGNSTTIKEDEVSPLVPPNQFRGWHEWYDLVKALNVTASAPSGTTLSKDGATTFPLDSAVTKTFRIDGIQQFVYTDTGKGLQPATVTPGTPGTRLAWTVYDDARLMMPATPYLLTTYMTTHENYTGASSSASAMSVMAGMRPSRRLTAPVHVRPSPSAAAQGGAQYVTADTQHLTTEPRYWDQYAIITPRATPNTNIAVPQDAADVPSEFGAVGHSTRPAAAASTMLQPLRVEKDEVVDIVVQGYASGSGGCDLHPWHMHGHSFWLLARGSGLYNAETSYSQPDTLISASPLRVDTVSGYPSNYSESRGEVLSGHEVKGTWRDPCGWFKIRFVADNPGYWLFHCHVGWHLEMGMSVVFDVSSELVGAPPEDYAMCGADGSYGTYSAALAAGGGTADTQSTGGAGGGDASVKEATMATFIALLVLLFALVVLVSGCYWLSSRKWKGVFSQVSLDQDEVQNPISTHNSGAGSGGAGGRPGGSGGDGGGTNSSPGRGGDVESGGAVAGAVQMVSLRAPSSGGYSAAAGGNAGQGAAVYDQEEDDGLEEVTFNDLVVPPAGKKQQGKGGLAAGIRGIKRTVSRLISHDS